MAQPFNPLLVEKGEIRAFIVEGRMMHAVYTWIFNRQQKDYHQMVDNYMPLGWLW